MLRLGMPKGRLLSRSQAAVTTLSTLLPRTELWPRYLRMPDIPTLVAEGALDVGIAGDEWLTETVARVQRVAPLAWYRIRVCALGLPHPRRLRRPIRLVSEYGTIARDYATARWGDNFSLRTVRGSVEQYVPEIADIAVECVETGDSMRRVGLVVLDTLFDADVWLICSPHLAATDPALVGVLHTWGARITERGDTRADDTAA
ncbi:hypothetical protein [Actinoplanes sp. NPDC051494]|uniref:hypothetical protein n=1 Tax=Actinoplanes sp. NPDC051494 TaxID=3363907 RepID=UPI00378FEF6F